MTTKPEKKSKQLYLSNRWMARIENRPKGGGVGEGWNELIGGLG